MSYEGLIGLFEEDSDCADTTLESSVFSSARSSSPEMTDVESIKEELVNLQLLQSRFADTQVTVQKWNMANLASVNNGELGCAYEEMNAHLNDLETSKRTVFMMCEPKTDFDTYKKTYVTYKTNMRSTMFKVHEVLEFKKQSLRSASGGGASTDTVKLPKLDPPKFNGKADNWMTFRDLFTAGVINQAKLSGAEKLQYLNNAVKDGEAFHIIKGFTITDANFTLAWAQLQDRYENKREIVYSLYKKFLNQPNITKENPKHLRNLIDISKECIRSLEVLGEPVGSESLLIFIMIERLDSDTRREWNKTLKGQDLPTMKDLLDFLENHVRGLIATGVRSTTSPNPNVKSNYGSNPSPKPNPNNSSCLMCKGSHSIFKCENFLALSADERQQIISSSRCCYNCFSSNHTVRECKSKVNCSVCQRRHHTLLCQKTATQSHVGSQGETTSLTTGLSSRTVLLSTAMVRVMDSFGGYRTCRVLLDNGSESSFVTEKCVKLLGLRPSKCDITITGISSVAVGRSEGVVGLTMSSLIKDFTFEVECLVFSKVTGRLPSFTCHGEKWEYLRNLPLADPKFLEPREVDILLGANVMEYLRLPGKAMRDMSSPVAWATELGWVISGNVGHSGSGGNVCSSHLSVRVHHSMVETEAVVRRFWELEKVPDHPQWTAEEKACEDRFESDHFRDQGGRYGSPLPFNSKIAGLGSSRHLAVKRLEQVERRLRTSPHREQYNKFMREYEELGHMELVPPDEVGEKLGTTNYLPHHFVLREESTSTKLRVVFDGSAKTSSGISINNCLLVGPKVQDDLFYQLLRFRMNPVALKADIVKMFRQFLVSRSDADFQRIVWRESPNQELKEYRLKTVTYGTASGPHSSVRCMKQISLDYASEHPEAAETFGKNFYVDDLLVSVPSAEDGIRLLQGLDVLARKAGLELGKWDSNNPKVLEHVPLESRAKNGNFKMDDEQFVSKALGVAWDSVNDFLLFQGFQFRNEPRITKRVVLSEMSRIFDPLGLLSPVTMLVKAFFQSLWSPIQLENGKSYVLDWDDELPDNLKLQWDSYQKGMSRINEVMVPRVLCVTGTESLELHGFSDASSEKGYSAVIYIRCIGAEGILSSRLMCGKTKVAPLKSQSVPKLELCGALLLAHLITSVVTATAIECPIYTWTDSELVLKWISNSSRRWKTFVANRVAEIQELIPETSWKFIPGELNPADCASRGRNLDELMDFSLWWNGPEFLLQPGLPTFVGKGIPESQDLEEKSKKVTLQVCTNVMYQDIFDRYSNLKLLKRVIAWMLRYKCNALKRQQRRFGEISAGELADAFTLLVKLAQRETFGPEIERLESGRPVREKSSLLSLNPFLDQNGVLRVGGRLEKADLPYNAKHQIILHGDHPLTTLLIRHHHEEHHAGFQLLSASLRREFWILKSRSKIRNLVRNCLRCKRLKAKTAEQLMGSLPSARVNPTRPFTHVGIDYAGPISLSETKGRGKKHFKGYFCIFVCFATKAVHLEYVLDMTTEAFIGTLKRFVSRRGMPTDIYSDCGSNFVGADKELKSLLSSSKHNNLVSRFLSDKGLNWHFNSPAAPHHGGLWEAGVKSVKHHLKRIIGGQSITVEEFNTVLCLIEAAMNSRPLCALSPDPEDFDVLTPGHFLIGEPLTAIPEPDLQHLKVNRLSRWQRSQQIVQHWWDVWSKEYLHKLQERGQWRKKGANVKIGDLVLIKEDNAPPLKWRMGRITAVHPGTDRLVRDATVKTATGAMKRDITKICPLLTNEEL